ncbi:MAG: cytochrome C [Desulfobacterales bacterium C00003060]|nr:MAG: cytochrome C [Desulfobacterales bacterium S3730MH5]OEU79067.1 MAG: cytochrome C [Desulfobacterales bacterium S5133MH4]OEU80662.1 MAG: cytochrome C [Desulfobacterales bacterium C00003060]
MYDGGKIITGVVIGLALLTFPFWYNLGRAVTKADPKLPTKEKQCVEPKAYMKTKHMQLLDLWRDSTVRAAKRSYIGFNGVKYDMSLQNTCMSPDCHSKKTEFCDQCHNYTAVVPYCWDCHIPPKEEKPKEVKPKEE